MPRPDADLGRGDGVPQLPSGLETRPAGRGAAAAAMDPTPVSPPPTPRARTRDPSISDAARPGAALIPTENTGATSQPAGTNSPLGARYPFEIRDHETLGRGARPKAAADAAAPDGSLDHDHDQASAKAHGRAPLPRGVTATRRSPKFRRFSSSDRARPPRPPEPRIFASRPSST